MNLVGTDMNPFRTNFCVRPFVATRQLLHLVLTNDFLVCVMRAARLAGRTFPEFVHRSIRRSVQFVKLAVVDFFSIILLFSPHLPPEGPSVVHNTSF
jgi:hypothetical protein